MNKWISAFRLRTLPLAFSSILMGTAFAVYEGYYSAQVFSFTLITTLLLQILSNLANDYGDGVKGTDNQRIGPSRAVQSGEITPYQMKNAILIFSFLSLFSGIALLYLVYSRLGLQTVLSFFVLGLFSILAAIFYTVGKKAYGYMGLGDLFVFIFFGLVGVVGSYYLQSGVWNPIVLFPATYIGLLAVAVLNLNNMRDADNDLKSGKITFAIILGKNEKLYHFSLIITSLILNILSIFFISNYWLFFSLLPYFVLLRHIKSVKNAMKRKEYDNELKKVAISSFFISLLTLLFIFFQ